MNESHRRQHIVRHADRLERLLTQYQADSDAAYALNLLQPLFTFIRERQGNIPFVTGLGLFERGIDEGDLTQVPSEVTDAVKDFLFVTSSYYEGSKPIT